LNARIKKKDKRNTISIKSGLLIIEFMTACMLGSCIIEFITSGFGIPGKAPPPRFVPAPPMPGKPPSPAPNKFGIWNGDAAVEADAAGEAHGLAIGALFG